ncbi:MAG: hypothetical protein H8E71_06505 [Candidatus Marinimicrobia bacterium]|nr:hypothetical protein [Candidatus Neomarinimicrobiota bacterium]MBL7109604.1 hypothetical protein [Candidatus Neomarinimicrobiota bacterium]
MKYFKSGLIGSVLALSLVVFLISCVQTESPSLDLSNRTIHQEVDFDISCMECHEEVTPEIVENWVESGHGILNYGCYICHGDGSVEFNVLPKTDNCIACHSSSEGHLMRMEYEGCFDCHDGHTLSAH